MEAIAVCRPRALLPVHETMKVDQIRRCMLAINDSGSVLPLSVSVLLVLFGLRAKKLHLNVLYEQDFLLLFHL